MTTGSWGRTDADVPTCTYRLLRCDRSLVYVGVTDDLESRLQTHSRKLWWAEVAHKDVIWFPDRLSALYEESRAIDEESPTYNDRVGISPFGMQPISVNNSHLPHAITREAKDHLMRDMKGRHSGGVSQLTFYGAPTEAFMVPIEWYLRASELMGESPDPSALPVAAFDV